MAALALSVAVLTGVTTPGAGGSVPSLTKQAVLPLGVIAIWIGCFATLIAFPGLRPARMVVSMKERSCDGRY